MKTVAEAIHFAHERRILHRDLKPSNVLIGADDQPRVTDFGLAKRLDASQLSTLSPQLTLSGDVLGSPSYMAPEQAGACHQRVSRATDVYALGAILYHLLTGRPPFAAGSVPATLHAVLEAEVVSPRLLASGLPRDLETICLKCLEKEPARRYATARELAEELGRFLRHEPVRARPVTRAGRAWRWAKRKPAMATLIALVHVVAAAGLAGILWQWQHASRNAVEAQAQRDVAEGRSYAGQMRLAHAEYKEGKLGSARERLGAWVSEPDQPDWRGFEWGWLYGLCATSLGEIIATNTNGFTAVAVSPDGATVALGIADGTIQLVDPRTRAAGRSWLAHAGAIDNLEFIPGHPHWLVTVGGDDGRLNIWDTRDSGLLTSTNCSGGFPFAHVAVSPSGGLLAAGTADGLHVWALASDPADQRPRLRLYRQVEASGPSAFSQDGRALAALSMFALGLWELDSDAVRWFRPDLKEIGQTISISPDGRWVATGRAGDDTVWCGPVKEASIEPRVHKVFANAHDLKFSADSEVLFAATRDQNIQGWSLDVRAKAFVLRGHSAGVNGLATHGQGAERVLYSASRDGTARRWRADTAALTRATEVPAEFEALEAKGGWTFLLGDFEELPSLAARLQQPGLEFDIWLAAGLSQATRVALQNYQGRKTNEIPLLRTLLPDFNRLVRGAPIYDPQRFQGITLRPETQALASQKPEGSKLERLNRLLLEDAYPREVSRNHAVGLGLDVSPDQTRLAVSLGREIQVLDLVGDQAPQRFIPAEVLGPEYAGVHAVAFSRRTNWLALGGMQGWVALLDGTTLALLRAPLRVFAGSGQVTDLAFALDDRLLVSGGMWGGVVARTDIGRWQNLESIPAPGNLPTERFAVSADGEVLVTLSPDHRLRVLKVATLQVVSECPQAVRFLHAVAFSPTDSRVAFSESGQIFLWDWDPSRRHPIRRWDGHRAEVLGLAFSPDGRTLASGSMDRTIRLWRPGLEQEVAVLTGHATWAGRVAFAAHGNVLASLGLQDADVLVWRAAAPDTTSRE